MKKIFSAVIQGVVKGLPLLRSTKEVVQSDKKLDVFDYTSLIVELSVVGLIAAFVFKKISWQELLNLIGLIGG